MHYKKSNRQRPTREQIEATLTFYTKSYDINRKNIPEDKSAK